VFLGVALAGFVVGGSWLFWAVAYTPVITVYLQNDTDSSVSVSWCGSDFSYLLPGQSVAIDPNRDDKHATCIIYRGESRIMIGCLFVPTGERNDGSQLSVSSMRTDVTMKQCLSGGF
jgi:hypothetical protein